MSAYLCGLDIGGTFTDCVLVDDGGRVVSAKAPSTPGDFAEGLMNALGAAARKCGRPVSDLLANTSLISHGTSVGTNAIVQKRGARIGLVTTRGHNDVIHIMRGSRGLDGREVRKTELGVSKVVIPQRAPAPAWCAFGAASVDLLHIYERVDIMASPFDLERVNALLASLRGQAEAQLLADGMPRARHRFRYALDMRHKGQIHEVEVGLDEMPVGGPEFDRLPERFTALYERLYGSGSSLAGARLEIVTARCRASAATRKPSFVRHEELTPDIPPEARRARRSVYWPRIAGAGAGTGTGNATASAAGSGNGSGNAPAAGSGNGTAPAVSQSRPRPAAPFPAALIPPSTTVTGSCRETGSRGRPSWSSTPRRWWCTRDRPCGWTPTETSSSSRGPPAPAAERWSIGQNGRPTRARRWQRACCADEQGTMWR